MHRKQPLRSICKEIAALDHIKCTFNADTGEFRVTLDGLTTEREEAVAYYTEHPDDAMATAQYMSAFRSAELRLAGHAFKDTIYAS